ncbi:MAG: uracil-DNA glycosylase [Pseudomonadota bacterium]
MPFFTEDLPHIEAQLRAETRSIFPPPPLTFAALERTQPEDCRVVILGQDPYHTPGKADGFAFSIPLDFGGRLDSLGNIFKEIESDLNVTRRKTSLEDWADQGVLLLNTALSVPQGAPKAHARIGWQALVDQVLDHLQGVPRAYLLWGGPAHQAARAVDGRVNLKIETAHPSPLSAHRGFFGAHPFSRTNAWLQARGRAPINWGDPEGYDDRHRAGQDQGV